MPTERRAWHRSLYWRIALGSLAVLARALAIEAALFTAVVVQSPRPLPPRALQRMALLLARDLDAELARDPSTDVARYLSERRETLGRPIAVVRRDGETVGDPLPERVREVVGERLQSGRFRPVGPIVGVAPLRLPPAGENDVPNAALVVMGGRPLGLVARELWPWVLGVTIVLAFAGTVIAAALVFGPAHRRLRDLERAAEALGAGDLEARASEAGGDEIAAVSRAFNRMAADLTGRIEQVEAADRMRRQLLADVSHELMTPLTAMRGYLETLRMPGLPLSPETREAHLGIVFDETLRIEHLVGDLLDLARLEAAALPLTREIVETATLFARIHARHDRVAQERDVRLETTIEPGAESLDADGGRLEQALQNLVANALRHTPPGGSVEVRVASEAHDLVFTVRDTGAGIPPDHIDHVFDRFYRADPSRTGATGGTGLGLSIVKAIAERHGGSVSVTSTPGVETVFAMRIPRS
jgi:signal transduction histidine kinase